MSDGRADGGGGAGDQPHDDVDGHRWLVVNGRRWRRQDPGLPVDVAERLLSHLGRGRSGVRNARRTGEDPAPWRCRVDLAKHGLGERGTPWWEQDEHERHERWRAALERLDALDAT
ncbi:2-polyprenylphenol hydroxylase [Ornithinimicrobium sp. W1679]|uniref:2-polyprenylphenol hydroxylase n=1 Tax=Ornithinimicrobium sp. W1679 TaxID=3418770 RepID=UPI003CF5CD84